MDPKVLKSKLVRLGITQTEIAAALGISRQAVNDWIHGRIESARIKEAVEKHIGVTVRRLKSRRRNSGDAQTHAC